MAGLTLDTGALIGYERADERVRGFLERAYGRGMVPTIPAGALAEAWRSGPRNARLARLKERCHVIAIDEQLAMLAGELLGRATAGRAAVVDATVIVTASHRGEAVLTADPGDLQPLADALRRGHRPQIIAIGRRSQLECSIIDLM